MNFSRFVVPAVWALAACLQSSVIAATADTQPASSTDILAPHISEQQYPLLPGGARDSFPSYNRGMWWFDYDIMDKHVLRPVVHGYVNWVPGPVRTGVSNVLFNLEEPNNTVNNLLLGEFSDSGVSLARFGVNSTIGVLGIFDIARTMGMDRHEMAMTTVLGRAKMTQGPYFMVPFAGPTTLRNSVGTVVDNLYWPYSYVSWPVTIARYVVSGIDSRAQVINQEGLVDNALDPYLTARDFYLQYQHAKVTGAANGGATATPKATDDADVEKYLNEIDN